MPKALVVVGLLLAAWPAAAQQVILKCKGPKGETIYQNRPCAWRGGTMEDVLVFDDPRDSPEARRRLDAIEQAQQARYREERRAAASNVRPPVLPSPRDRQRAECTAARERAHRAAFDGTPDALRQAYERHAVDACFGL